MKSIKTLTILFLVLLATAQTVVADEFCELGIFFDEAATTRGTTAAPGTTVHAYLIMMTESAPIQLMDFRQHSLFIPGATDCWTEIRGGGINHHIPWSDEDLSLEITWDIPLLVDGTAVLADIYIPITSEISIMIFAECHTFGHVTGQTNTVDWIHCTYCDMMPPNLTIAAVINADYEPVSAENSEWSVIKRLYR
jgi:hypothetical protein